MTRDSNEQGTIESWLAQQGATPQETNTVAALASAAIEIARELRHAPLDGTLGLLGKTNIQGELQQQLDVIANDSVVDHLAQCGGVAVMVSEEVGEIIVNQNAEGDARLAVCFDPLDGSSNIETNGTVGTIFSVLELRRDIVQISARDVLDSAHRQKVAGYFLYGPSTLLVMTTGNAVALFALKGEHFTCVKPDLAIPQSTTEFAINMAYRQFWPDGVRAYIDECLAGTNGPRSKKFNMRWMGSMVADMHRIFMRGGIFIYPKLSSPNGENGKLRFLYEVNPMAMLVEAAGGRALLGEGTSKDCRPQSLHQRVPFAAGSAEEVQHYIRVLNG